MKRVLISCAALLAAPVAVAQPGEYDRADMRTYDGPPVELAGHTVPRGMPVTPPGWNTANRMVPEQAAEQILDALRNYDYPRCTPQIMDRCVQ